MNPMLLLLVLAPQPSTGELTSTLSVLSAMITPTVLILACGSLILTTSQRLTRVIDRVRELSSEVELLAADTTNHEFVEEKRNALFDFMHRAINRARLLQRALTFLYVALGTFVATSVAIGVVAMSGLDLALTALILVFVGAGLMLAASVLLILESRVGLASTYAEMDFLWRRGQHHAPPAIRELERSFWKLFGKKSSGSRQV